MHSEFSANQHLQALANERARWAAVLARPANFRPVVRRSFWSLIFGL